MIAASHIPPAGWSGTVVFGEIDVAVRAAGPAPAAWPSSARLRIVATQLDRGGRAPLAERAVLVAAPGSERAYRLLADALALESAAVLLDAGDAGGGARLRSIAGALVIEAVREGAPDRAAPSDEELALALTLLRSFPPAIVPVAGARPVAGPARAPVTDLSDRRRARAAAAEGAASEA